MQVEQPGIKLAPFWDVGVTGRGFTGYITTPLLRDLYEKILFYNKNDNCKHLNSIFYVSGTVG